MRISAEDRRRYRVHGGLVNGGRQQSLHHGVSARPIDQHHAGHRVSHVPRDRSQVEHALQLFHPCFDVRLFERQRHRLRGLTLRLVELVRQVAGLATQPLQLAAQAVLLRGAYRLVLHARSPTGPTRGTASTRASTLSRNADSRAIGIESPPRKQ